MIKASIASSSMIEGCGHFSAQERPWVERAILLLVQFRWARPQVFFVLQNFPPSVGSHSDL